MTTIYIDVYFLINFTVDILAAYLAVKFLRIRTSIKRLLCIGALGALSACLDVFFENRIIRSVNIALFLIAFAAVIAGGIKLSRRIKVCGAFLASEIMIGGTVSFGYTLLDKYLGPYLSEADGGGENRNALIFSLLILLAIGVSRIFMFLFTGTGSEKSVKIRIEIEGSVLEAEALVDSGNLVRDPMNMYPVLFIKKRAASKILPESVLELSGVDTLSDYYRKRIRLIPVTRGGTTHVMTGIKPDKVLVLGKNEIVGVTVAIDKEGGSFGGYDALMPSAALGDAI